MDEVRFKKRQKVALVCIILQLFIITFAQDYQGDRFFLDFLVVGLLVLCLGVTWTDPFGENDEGQG